MGLNMVRGYKAFFFLIFFPFHTFRWKVTTNMGRCLFSFLTYFICFPAGREGDYNGLGVG